MDWLYTEDFVRVEHKSRSNVVVGHSWDPYLIPPVLAVRQRKGVGYM